MNDLETRVSNARAAAEQIAHLSTATKDRVIRALADSIDKDSKYLYQANEIDILNAQRSGVSEAKIRRLTLSRDAFSQMSAGLRQVADLPDPVGQVTKQYKTPSGLDVRKVRCPLGVILMIYEARPNVTVDAFALCFKASNACILKGGREASESNHALAELIWIALEREGVSRNALTLITNSDREQMKSLLQMHEHIDLVIPRGGTELIKFVHEHSRIPTVQHFQGVCHIFVDATADLEQALEICTSAKTSAPAACNSVETVLIHEMIALDFVPRLVKRLQASGVEVRGDAAVCRFASGVRLASKSDWGREFLDMIVAIRVVTDLDAAIEHIHRYGSNHTEAILTQDTDSAERFVNEVQSSCVLVNASTRFNDGYQLGLGAEIGISTSKVHAYGAMGLEELTSQRYIVRGSGQAR